MDTGFRPVLHVHPLPDGGVADAAGLGAPALDGVPPERVTDRHYWLAGIWVECTFCPGWVVPGDVVEEDGPAAFSLRVASQRCYQEGLSRL